MALFKSKLQVYRGRLQGDQRCGGEKAKVEQLRTVRSESKEDQHEPNKIYTIQMSKNFLNVQLHNNQKQT